MKNDFAISAIVLAAGLSERMGRFKPLLPLGAKPAIERVVTMFQVAGIKDVLVVGGHRAAEIRQAIDPLNARCVENPAYRDGMFSSVLAGIRALPPVCRAFFIHPVDIPGVRFQTVERMVASFEETAPAILYPVFDGRRGHPTLIRSSLVPEILKWPGSGGLRAFLERYEVGSRELPVADEAVLLDMDRPEDYTCMVARMTDGGLPNENECRALMDEIQALPPAVARHCQAVADVARLLSAAVSAAGSDIDIELVRTAALLHDIARVEKDHAAAGARLLKAHGFLRLAPLVATHMDLEVAADQPVDEAQIVYLADKLVAGDQRVDLEQRFARKMEKYGRDPDAISGIERRRETARRILGTVENITGRSLDAILNAEDPAKGEDR
ncbi:MAG: DVU_1551 family NTP transferase [Pseudomonadota bacterium]